MAIVSSQKLLSYLHSEGKAGATYVDALQWVAAAKPADLEALLDKEPGAILFATVGPTDLLWTPAGSITFHRVMPDSDVVGFRWGGVGRLDRVILPPLRDDLNKTSGVQDHIVEALAALDEMFEKPETKPGTKPEEAEKQALQQLTEAAEK